jgi:hypothetical protein
MKGYSKYFKKYMFCKLPFSCTVWNTFWGDDRENKQIFKLQKKVLRLIINVERYTSNRVLFKTLNILPVPCNADCGVHDNEHRWVTAELTHDYNTHHKSDLQSQFCKTDICKKKCK